MRHNLNDTNNFFVIENSRKAFLVVVIVFMLRILIRVHTYVYVDNVRCVCCKKKVENVNEYISVYAFHVLNIDILILYI